MTDKPLSEMTGEEHFDQMREMSSLSDYVKKRIASMLTDIQESQGNAKKSLATMREMRNDATRVAQTIRAYEGNAMKAERDIKSLRDGIETLKKEMNGHRDNVNSLFSTMQGQRDNVGRLISDASKSFKEKSEEMSELVEKIESLLPGATSAGLAETFYQAQKQKTHFLYWIGFIGSLFCVAIGYGYFFHNSLSGNEPFTWGHVLARATIGIPLLWIAWYCQRSLSQMNRIREEYHHKERVMRVYEGFAKQINSSDTDVAREHNVDLVSAVIRAIERNPADVLDPSATMLDSFMKRRKNDGG